MLSLDIYRLHFKMRKSHFEVEWVYMENNMMNNLEVNFKFTDTEKNAIVGSFLTIDVNPYKFYPAFKKQVRHLIADLPKISRFMEFMEYQRSVSTYDSPFVFIENCPIDLELPVFSTLCRKNMKKRRHL